MRVQTQQDNTSSLPFSSPNFFRAKDSVKHFHVRRQFGKYSFGFNEFPSLQDFCSHLANQPLLGSETGELCTFHLVHKLLFSTSLAQWPCFLFHSCNQGNLLVLRFPYPRQVEEPSIYETVCVHTAMQTGRHEHDLVPNAPAVSQCDIIQTYIHTHIWKSKVGSLFMLSTAWH